MIETQILLTVLLIAAELQRDYCKYNKTTIKMNIDQDIVTAMG